MKTEIKVCVGNYGYYNEGELRDQWITLPKTGKEINEFLTNGLQDECHEEIYISDYDGLPFNFPNLFDEFTHLEDLNLLALAMQQNKNAVEIIQDLAEAGYDEPESILGLINWILQGDDIAYYPYDFDWNSYITRYWSNEAKLGYQIAREDGLLATLEKLNAEHCFDFEKYGEDCEQVYTACDSGYLDARCDMPDEDYYSREEIIEELVA